MKYTLCSSGKRLRPILTKLIAKSIGKEFNVDNSAIAIEVFHAASLIADDLPCMDNDDIRRGKPSLHKKYGQSTALLTSYALLVEGFSLIQKSGIAYYTLGYGDKNEANERVSIALRETTELSGAKGATLGQYIDINQSPTQSREEFEWMYYLKTGTLFQGAFTLGYLFGGGEIKKLPLIKKMSRHLGFAFQIRDDLEDLNEERKSFAKIFGEKESIERCKKEIEGFFEALDALQLKKSFFDEIIDFLFPKKIFRTFSHALL